MRRATGRFLASLPLVNGLVLVLAAATACNSAPEIRRGTIVYHDPDPARGDFQRRRDSRQPVTMRITTESESNKDKSDGDVVVVKGAMDPKVGNRLRERNMAREVFGTLSERNRSRVVTPDAFADIWSNLLQAGLLELPTFPGARPPADVPRIEVRSDAGSWIFLRPDSFYSVASRDQASIREAAIWRQSVVLIQTTYSSGAAHFQLR